jgi:hypothetical protein
MRGVCGGASLEALRDEMIDLMIRGLNTVTTKPDATEWCVSFKTVHPPLL